MILCLFQKPRQLIATTSFVWLCCAVGGAGCASSGKSQATDHPASANIKLEESVKVQPVANLSETSANVQNSHQVNLLFEQAIQSMENGRADRAMDDLRQVIALAPTLSVPHNNLGILYKQKGLLDNAIQEYQEAIRLKPDYAEAHHNLGIAYREKGLFKEAEKAYLDALRFKSDLAEAYFNLGVLCELYLNRPTAAVQHYTNYLRWGSGQKRQEVELWISNLERRLQTTEPER